MKIAVSVQRVGEASGNGYEAAHETLERCAVLT